MISSQQITTQATLRKIITAYPKMLDKRVKDSLDALTLEYLQHSRLAVLSLLDDTFQYHLMALAETIQTDTLNSEPAKPEHSQMIVANNKCLEFYSHNISPELKPSTSLKASLFFFIPGIHHAIRINGSVDIKTSQHSKSPKIIFDIQQVYFHCGRAAIRAELWKNEYQQEQINTKTKNINHFLDKCSYILLATQDENNNTQLSPRGDQVGFIKPVKNIKTNSNETDKTYLFIPERPGNKIAISLTNILVNPNISLIGFIAGSQQVITISAKAQLTCQPELLKLGEVQESKGHKTIKRPKIGILLEVIQCKICEQAALTSSGIWQSENHINAEQITAFSKALSVHISGKGLLGKITHKVVDHVVESDKKKLY